MMSKTNKAKPPIDTTTDMSTVQSGGTIGVEGVGGGKIVRGRYKEFRLYV